MPRCAVCGEDNPERARFCLACAAPLAAPGRHRPRSARSSRSCSATWSGSPPGPTRPTPRTSGAASPLPRPPQAEIERLRRHGRQVHRRRRPGGLRRPRRPRGRPRAGRAGGPGMLGPSPSSTQARPGLDLAVRVASTPARRWSCATVPGPARRSPGTWSTPPRGSRRSPRRAGSWWGRRPTGPPGGCSTTRSWPRSRSRARPTPVPIWRAEAPAAAPASSARPRARRPRSSAARPSSTCSEGRSAGPSATGRELVTVVGEPGIGKSRLVFELAALRRRPPRAGRLAPGPLPALWRGMTFWALGEIVKAQAGILESDPPAEAAAKLGAPWPPCSPTTARRRLAAGPAGARWSGSPAATPGGEPGRSRSPPGGGSSRPSPPTGPLVLVVEDLHWADQAMLEFLEHLVELGGRRAPADRGHGPPGAARAPAGLGRRQPERRPRSPLAPLTDARDGPAAGRPARPAGAARPGPGPAAGAGRRQPAVRRGVRADAGRPRPRRRG